MVAPSIPAFALLTVLLSLTQIPSTTALDLFSGNAHQASHKHASQPKQDVGAQLAGLARSGVKQAGSNGHQEPDDLHLRTHVVLETTTAHIYLPVATPTSKPSTSRDDPDAVLPSPLPSSRPRKKRSDPAHILSTLRFLHPVYLYFFYYPVSFLANRVAPFCVNVLWGPIRWLFGVTLVVLGGIWSVVSDVGGVLLWPLLAPAYFAFVIPGSYLLALLHKFQPLLVFLSTAAFIGILSGLVAGFGNGIVGDWISGQSSKLQEGVEGLEGMVGLDKKGREKLRSWGDRKKMRGMDMVGMDHDHFDDDEEDDARTTSSGMGVRGGEGGAPLGWFPGYHSKQGGRGLANLDSSSQVSASSGSTLRQGTSSSATGVKGSLRGVGMNSIGEDYGSGSGSASPFIKEESDESDYDLGPRHPPPSSRSDSQKPRTPSFGESKSRIEQLQRPRQPQERSDIFDLRPEDSISSVGLRRPEEQRQAASASSVASGTGVGSSRRAAGNLKALRG